MPQLKPRLHADLIKAWADGATIQMQFYGVWQDCGNPMWDDKYPFRIKPREFPKTSLTGHHLYHNVYYANPGNARSTYDRFVDVAAAAIKQYILDQEAAANALNDLPTEILS